MLRYLITAGVSLLVGMGLGAYLVHRFGGKARAVLDALKG